MTTERRVIPPDFVWIGSSPVKVKEDDKWMGWESPNTIQPKVLLDDQGRVNRIRAPVLDLKGLTTPTHLFYVVQHFGAPEPVRPEDWALAIDGEVKRPLSLTYEDLLRLPGRTVRTVMECSGSDADFFEYFKGEKPRPYRDEQAMILSAGEFTGVPLGAVLDLAGLTGKAAWVRAEGWDKGLPANATPELQPFYYDKALPVQKALHPDTILAYAMNGELLEHLHGAPIRLLVPGWSGNWSVKWLRRLQVMDSEPDLWYHYHFYYYASSPEDPEKELITNIMVKSIITSPKDQKVVLPAGQHVIRGLAWGGSGLINRVEVSVDGGQSWNTAHLEEPRERWMWVRWSHLWDVQEPGEYAIMSRATDEMGNVQPREPRYNNMRKNFNAIVPYQVTITAR